MPTSKSSLGPQTLTYPQPAFLVAGYDADEKPNAMVAAWGGICSSDPVSLTVSIRPGRYSFESISARKAFTVNIPTEGMAAAADFAGIVSGRKYDKFAALGWTAVKAEKVDAPYIAECPVVLECKLSQTVELGAHVMFIGEIMDVKADENCLDPSGRFPDIARFKPLLFDSGSKNYYGIGNIVGKAFSDGKRYLEQ